MGGSQGSNQSVSNRRTASRYLVRWSAASAKRPAGTAPARIYDISGTGLQFGSSERYHVGDKVPIDVIVGHGAFFRTVVLIMRECGKHGLEYRYGGRFLSASAMDREILRSRLKAMGDTGDYERDARVPAVDERLSACLGVKHTGTT